MRSKRLLAFIASLTLSSVVVGACGESGPGGGTGETDAGIGGVGPFTGNGGSIPIAGQGGSGPDAGESNAPVARDDAFDVSAEAVSSIPAPGVLENDDADAADIVSLSVATRLGGSVVLTADGSFVYTPPTDPGQLPRVDDFTYTLRSDDGESTATVSLTLFGTPTANDDHYGTLMDTPLSVEAEGVLHNDVTLGAIIDDFDVTTAAGGTVAIEPSGALSYTPPTGFVGADSFFYTLKSVAGRSTAIVNVQVGREPVAADDTFVSSKGEIFSPERSVLDNDALGVPGATLISFGGGSLGGSAEDHPVGTTASFAGSTVTLTADGMIVFEPEASLVGPYEFVYRLQNPSGISEGTVLIDVHEAALAFDDEFDMLAGETLSIPADSAESLLADDVGTPAPVITSFGGGSLGGSVADHAAGESVNTGFGTLTVNADGSITYESTPEDNGELTFFYHIENAAGNDEGEVTITVAHAPEFTSPNELTLRAGTTQNLPFEIEATGTPEPTISLEGELPSGVTFEDGTLTGSAAVESGGTYTVTVTAENDIEPDAVQTLTITVETQSVLLGESNPTFTVGTAGSYAPSVIGGVPTPSLSLDGFLPEGLTFEPTTGTISGTPAEATGGTYPLEMTASNAIGADVTLSLTLEVLESPEITSPDATTFTVGEPGSFEITTTGNPERTVSVTGTLPAGVTFNSATGTLEGTPGPGAGGEHELGIEATNGVAPDALQEFTLTVNEAPTLSGDTTATFTIGSEGSYSVTAGGFPVPTLNLSGSLPAGLSFDAATGTISGTPQAGTSGTHSVTIGADNGIGASASLPVTLDVREVSSITSLDATTFTVGAPGIFQVTATGTPTPTLSVTGTLPSGVAFTPGTGELAGTPAVGTGGVYVLTFGADNAVGVPGSQTFTLTVNEAPAVIGAATATFVVGQADTYTTTRAGFPVPVLNLSGTLPAGLSFDATAGTISGTPEAGTGGSYSVTISGDNGVLPSASLPVTITVNEGPAITSEDESTFTVGSAGTFTVTATGTPAPTLSVEESLPSGLTFTPGTGELAGTPAPGTGGTHELTFSADNGVGTAGSQTFTLTINEAPSLVGAATTTFTVGSAGSYAVTRGGFPVPTLSLSGSLPSGLTFDASTGTISGTPASGTGGSYPVTIGADNGIGSAASFGVTITVNEGAAFTSADATTFTVGTAGSFTATATGTPAPTFSVTAGSLPSGVTLSAAGVLSGTPASGTGGTYTVTLDASNGVGSSATQSFTLTVNEAPSVSGAATTTFQVGQSGSYSVTSGGFPAPTFSVTAGSLPSGLSIDTSTGTISGTPASGTAGSYPVTISADNGVGSIASHAFTITVNDGAAITSSNSATFTVGSAGTFTVTATGTPAPTLSVSGSLPSGLTFTPGTGALSGTPASGTGGTYTVTFGADNGVGTAASQSFTLTVNEAPSISGAATTTFTVGTAGTYTPSATGFPAASFGITGALPSGLSFSAVTGAITGTPASGTGGSYPVTISASNGIGSADTLSLTITVNEGSSITSADNATFTAGSAGTFTVTATGTPAPTFSVSAGSLPAGVTLDATSGVLSGTPGAGTGGTHTVTISASNGVGVADTQSFTLTVNEASSISGAASATFSVGSAGTYSVTSSGFPAPTLSLTGTLPSGLSFDAGAGTISGTPASGTAGSYPVTISANNGVGSAASVSLTIDVTDAATITSANTTTFAVGTPGTFSVTATGTPAPTLSLTGALPTGVTFTPSTGELAGTPAVGTGGSYALTFGADNGVGSGDSQSFTLVVSEAPAISGASPTTFTVGEVASYTPTVTGFPVPVVSFSGTLPNGVTFSPLTGTLSGTPEDGTGGTYGGTFTASNGIGSDATLSLTINVAEAPEFTSSASTTFEVGTQSTFTVTASGNPPPSFTVSSGSLPSGLTLDPTGALSGTPGVGTGGEYNITITASNGGGQQDATQDFTLTVNEAALVTGAPTTTFAVGESGSYSVTRSGFPTPTLSLTGTLPTGLSFDASTGTISGTPGSGTAGTYPVTIGADNGVGSAASHAVTITVNDPAAITSSNATTFTVGSAGTFTVTATGTPSPTLSLTGSLPTGVTFNAGTGALSGTPAAGTGGTYNLTVGANNGVGTADSQSFTLTVNEAPSISGAATTTFTVGSSGSYSPTASGFPAPSFSLAGSLPSGLSFSTVTGVISGTPSSGTGGSYPVTISAGNGVGSDDSVSVTISVVEAPSITSTDNTTFTAGSAGSFSVTATGTPAPSFSVTAGALPSGVTLDGSGSLSGTPGAGTGGVYPVTIGAANGVGSAASQSFTLTVVEAPSISGAPPSPADEDEAYTHTFTLGGFPAPTTSVVAGTLPAGLTLSSSGVLSGTPTTPGTFSDITVRASNTVSFADITFTIEIETAALPPSTTNDSFTVTGNLAIDVPVGSSVLNNDTLNGATITGFGASVGTAGATSPGNTGESAQGGSVTLAADGSFSYDPPAGVTGSDSFAYTVTNAAGLAVGTVSFTISNRVWFVDASAASGGNGKPGSPFQALTNVTSTASGDVIYAFRSASPYAAKTLSSGQRLLGQGVTVDSTHLGFSLAPFTRNAGTLFGTAGANSSMRTLTLASSNYVRGFDVSASAGTRGLVGAGAASLDIAGMAVSTTNAAAVDLSSTSGTVSLRSVTASGGTNGILLTSTTGSFTVTGDGGGTNNASGGTISSTTGDGVRLNSAQNVTIRSLTISSIPSGFYGIHGNSVNNLTLQGISTSGGTQGLSFEDNSGNPANLTGTVSITNSSFTSHTTAIGIRNDTGTLSSLTMDDNTFSTVTSTGILVQIRGDAALTAMTFRRNSLTNVSTTLSTNAFNFFVGTNTSGSATLTPFAKVTVENNTFTGSNGIPIRLRSIETNGTLHAIVRSNTVSGLTGTNTNAMRIDSGNSAGNSTVCAQIQSNSFTPSGTAQGISVRRDTSDTFGIVGLTPSPSSVASDVTNFLNGQNPGNTSTVVTGVTAFASGYTACTIP